MHYLDSECTDLKRLYTRFNFPVYESPQLLPLRAMTDRVNHLKEELRELQVAVAGEDLAEIADALVDLVVIAKGTAVMMGLPWEGLWREVQRANESKEVGINPKRPNHQYDLIKPEDWVGPRIQEVIDGSL